MIVKFPGIKLFSALATLTVASIVHNATNETVFAQKKLTTGTPAANSQAPKGRTSITDKDGVKTVEEFDGTNFLFKRTSTKLIEKGNVTETTIENFNKTTGDFYEEVIRKQKDGLSERKEYYENNILSYVDITTQYKNGKIKEAIRESYTKGILSSKIVVWGSEDGKKVDIEARDGQGQLQITESEILIDDGYLKKNEFYNNGVLARTWAVTGTNLSKFKAAPPDGNHPPASKKIEMLLFEIYKSYDGQGKYEAKQIIKKSTDDLIEIAEVFDSSDKLFKRTIRIDEYKKDKTGQYNKYHSPSKRIEEDINEKGICVHKTETQYRADGSKKIIDDVFANNGKLQSRVTQEEILNKGVVETIVENYDENGKKIRNEKTTEPLKLNETIN